jgi:hypothetical protein
MTSDLNIDFLYFSVINIIYAQAVNIRFKMLDHTQKLFSR